MKHLDPELISTDYQNDSEMFFGLEMDLGDVHDNVALKEQNLESFLDQWKFLRRSAQVVQKVDLNIEELLGISLSYLESSEAYQSLSSYYAAKFRRTSSSFFYHASMIESILYYLFCFAMIVILATAFVPAAKFS